VTAATSAAKSSAFFSMPSPSTYREKRRTWQQKADVSHDLQFINSARHYSTIPTKDLDMLELKGSVKLKSKYNTNRGHNCSKFSATPTQADTAAVTPGYFRQWWQSAL
jgi:hypothetical protein